MGSNSIARSCRGPGNPKIDRLDIGGRVDRIDRRPRRHSDAARSRPSRVAVAARWDPGARGHPRAYGQVVHVARDWLLILLSLALIGFVAWCLREDVAVVIGLVLEVSGLTLLAIEVWTGHAASDMTERWSGSLRSTVSPDSAGIGNSLSIGVPSIGGDRQSNAPRDIRRKHRRIEAE
jgi:hypothetical protein